MSRNKVRTRTKGKVLVDEVRTSSVDDYLLRRRRRWIVIPLAVLVVLGVLGYALFNQISKISVPVDYATDEDHFKYGSIGSDTLDGRGFPYWIWISMPEVCPDLLPNGYLSLGLAMEPGMDRPIGFSKRRTGFFDSVGINCAACHTATVRETKDSQPQVYLAASSHQLDLWGYFDFLFSCGQDARFTPERVLQVIEQKTDLSPVDRFVFKQAIKQIPGTIAQQAANLSWIRKRPLWGPGRVDTFNPYKSLIFDLDMSNDDTVGTADFMTIWNQQLREGLYVHWDGNNPSVTERNLSAAIGAGASFDSLDHPRLNRIKAWITTLKAPLYPFRIDYDLAALGEPIYQRECVDCHEPEGDRWGTVIENRYLGVDTERADAFDQEMANRMNTIGIGYSWRFSHFRTTDGYASHPLDGVWLRAPYLHNGSVPTMRDLLTAPQQRPKRFYRGYDVYDQQNMGFVSTVPRSGDREYFGFDTSLRGNGNGGHTYGVKLSDADKDALLEYLKTL